MRCSPLTVLSIRTMRYSTVPYTRCAAIANQPLVQEEKPKPIHATAIYLYLLVGARGEVHAHSHIFQDQSGRSRRPIVSSAIVSRPIVSSAIVSRAMVSSAMVSSAVVSRDIVGIRRSKLNLGPSRGLGVRY